MSRHHTKVEKRHGLGITVYVAFCSCGWESQPHPSVRAAGDDESEHVSQMVHAEPEGAFDRCELHPWQWEG